MYYVVGPLSQFGRSVSLPAWMAASKESSRRDISSTRSHQSQPSSRKTSLAINVLFAKISAETAENFVERPFSRSSTTAVSSAGASSVVYMAADLSIDSKPPGRPKPTASVCRCPSSVTRSFAGEDIFGKEATDRGLGVNFLFESALSRWLGCTRVGLVACLGGTGFRTISGSLSSSSPRSRSRTRRGAGSVGGMAPKLGTVSQPYGAKGPT